MRARLSRLCCIGAAIAVATCVASDTETCDDGTLCIEGTRCFAFSPDDDRCVSPAQLDACDGDDAACIALGGTCLGASELACFVPVCGDGNTDAPEVCDDRNTDAGDGCSASCLSREICGNQIIDLVAGEQCDEGSPQLSGDGCSISCIAEYRVWRDVTPRPPSARSGIGAAVDPRTGVVLFGGVTGDPVDIGSNAQGAAAFDETWRWNAGWILAESETTPPRLARVAFAHDAANKRVLMVGGLDGQGNRVNTTWVWNGIDWTLAAPPTPILSRADAGMACTPARCVLFGGSTGSAGLSPSVRGDTWVYAGDTWRNLDPPAGPSSRAFPVVVYHEADQRVILFGGQGSGSGSATYNDTWQMRDGSETWEAFTSLENPPRRVSGGAQPSGAYDPIRQKVVLVANEETWLFDEESGWENTSVDLPIPHPTLVWSPERARVIALSRGVAGNVLVAFEWSGMFWQATAHPSATGGAYALAAAYDELRGRTVILDRVAQTLEWNGVGWQRFAVAPAHRVETALAYDRACDRVLAYGGADGSNGATSDVMSAYANAAWSVEPAVTRPAPRRGHGMVYDEANEAMLVFGGRASNGAMLDELWRWSGPCGAQQWTAIPKTGAWPAARSNATFVYDRASGTSLLFGGVGSDGPLGDTWELDGTTWTELAPASAPPARQDAMSVFDPRRESIVLHGGRDRGAAMNDTWEWKNATWAQVPTVLTPAQRAGAAAARDITGSIVVIGGENAQEALTSVIRLRSELGLEPTELCFASTNDRDGDGLAGCADPDCWGRCEPTCRYGASCAGPRCGDGVCAPVEDFVLCPGDCAPP